MIPPSQWIIASPDSRFVHRNPHSPHSPLSTERYSESPSPKKMPATRNGTAGVKHQEHFEFFMSNFSVSDFDAAETDGVLMPYKWDPDSPGKKDKRSLQLRRDIILKQLRVHPDGLFLKSELIPALEAIQDKTGRKFCKKASIREQAANYVRYFSDIRACKKSVTAQSRTPMWLQTLIAAMNKPSLL